LNWFMICFPVLEERAEEAYQSMQRETKRSMLMVNKGEEEEEGVADEEAWIPSRGAVFIPREVASKCKPDRSIE
jgi:hypothetical protein